MHGLTIHHITAIKAFRLPYAGSPLRIDLTTQYSEFPTGLMLFIDDSALVDALVEAIQSAVSRLQGNVAMQQAAE